MASFDRRIEALWPDKDTPGWHVVQLECGHITHQPIGNTNKICHCGDCVLGHQEHMRKLAQSQRAAVALADTVFDQTYGPEEPNA